MRSVAVVLGVPVDDVTMHETVDRFCEMARVGRVTGRTHQVTTVNVDFVVNSLIDPELRSVLQQADLAMPDGMPVVWAARLLGVPLRERVAGADLVEALSARSARDGLRIYLFGAGPGIAERAAALMRERHPGAHVVGDGGPFFDHVEDMDPAVLERIRAERPDVLCVAFGNPKQERWIARYRDELGVPVLVGVGGTLDFLVGTKQRAPRWMQRTGLEWLHRLGTEPKRLWKRYARCLGLFGPLVVEQLWQMRPVRPAPPDVSRVGSVATLRLRGRLDLASTPLDPEAALALESCRHLLIDVTPLRRVDHATAASLFRLASRVRSSGGEVLVVTPDGRPPRSLQRIRLDQAFADTRSAQFPPVAPDRVYAAQNP